jgi:hypothetical protein
MPLTIDDENLDEPLCLEFKCSKQQPKISKHNVATGNIILPHNAANEDEKKEGLW